MARSNDRQNSGGRGGKKHLAKTLVVGPFRMAFAALFDPEEDDNGNEKFKVTMLFPPDCKSIPEIEDALYECMEDRFGSKRDWPNGRNDSDPETKFYDAGTKKYTGFKEGWMALTATSFDAPGVVDADKNEVVSKREAYNGRWARAQITITSYDNKSKGVTAYLNHVQLLDHDDPFSGKGNASDAFDKYESNDRGRKRGRDDEDDDDRGNRRDSRRDRDDDNDTRGGNSRDDRRGRDRDDDKEDNRGAKGRSGGRNRDSEDEENDRRGGKKEEARRGSRDEDDEDKPRNRRRDEDDEDRPSRNRRRDEDDRSNSSRRETSKRSRDDDWN